MTKRNKCKINGELEKRENTLAVKSPIPTFANPSVQTTTRDAGAHEAIPIARATAGASAVGPVSFNEYT